MAKNKIRPAVAARRKAAMTARHKIECLGHATNSCIPKKVNNPNITINEEGKPVLNYNLDALTPYREMKKKWQAWNKRFAPDVVTYKRGACIYSRRRRSPWYMMTSGKQKKYGVKTYDWGQASAWVRVKSEAGKFHDRYIIPKMTRTRYNELLVEAKLKDWEKKHPRPIPRDDAQRDLFEAQFMVPWIDAHTKAREKIIEFVNNIGNRAKVYARYEGDDGYPTKVMELKSDGSKFTIMDGKYTNHLDSANIRRVQRAANLMHKDNPRLIALKIVDKGQECILVPAQAA